MSEGAKDDESTAFWWDSEMVEFAELITFREKGR